LIVACGEPREYPPDQLRQAVDYLKTIPDPRPEKKFVGLIAQASVRAGHYRLQAMAFLKLADIIGKTTAEVWERFDKIVDADRESLARKSKG
jgi:hypothetical protein